ncbi:hypothetical protein COCCADRAFT_107535, partial [Bipolaris zeicola 26-R-13]
IAPRRSWLHRPTLSQLPLQGFQQEGRSCCLQDSSVRMGQSRLRHGLGPSVGIFARQDRRRGEHIHFIQCAPNSSSVFWFDCLLFPPPDIIASQLIPSYPIISR